MCDRTAVSGTVLGAICKTVGRIMDGCYCVFKKPPWTYFEILTKTYVRTYGPTYGPVRISCLVQNIV